MNEEIITLINNISENIFNELVALKNSRINQLNDLIEEEKELSKKESLINEKKQLFDNFIKQVVNYFKTNLTEQQMKDILNSFLTYNDGLMKSYNAKYRSFDIESDTLYYILQGLCSSIIDKNFVSNVSENYFREIAVNRHDIMLDCDPIVFQIVNYNKPLLLLSYCKDENLINEYLKEKLNQKGFITQFSNSSIFDDKLLIEFAKDFFNNNKGNEELEIRSWNFYNELLQNEAIPLVSRKKITDLFSVNFPEYYEYEKGHIYKSLIYDYDSAIRSILENDFRGGQLITILAQSKIKGEDLIKLYNDERVISRLTQDYIVVNQYTDSETKYNILFHTLLTRYALGKNIMYSAILSADDDLLYSLLSHTDSLNYILSNQEFKNKFIEHYFNLSHNKNTNAKMLEIFKDVLTPEQLNLLFQPNQMPYDVHLQYYLNEKYCYKIINAYHPLYNPNGDKDKIKNINDVQNLIYKLYNDNQYLFKTFNPNIINDDILKFDYRFISLISKYKDLQASISHKINENNDQLFNVGKEDEWIESIKSDPVRYERFIRIHGNSKDHAECKPIDSKICGKVFVNMLNIINDIDSDYITQYIADLDKITVIRNVYSDVFHDVYLRKDATSFEKFVINVCQGLDVNTITPNQWKTLTKIFLHDVNQSVKDYYISVDINNLQDVDTYDDRRRKKLDILFAKALNDKEIEQAINIFLNKYYDIDINKAREIVEIYDNDLDNIKDTKYSNSIDLIKKIKNVLSINNLQELYDLYQKEIELSFDDVIIFTNSLNKIFGNSLSNSLTSFEDMKQINNNQFNFPPSINVYEAPDDFVMLVHSTLAYGALKLIDDNYKTSWNENDRTSNHGICCSLIANDYLGTAEIGDVLLGFNDLSESSLIKSAPYDLFTRNDRVNITAAKKSKFFTPRNIINHTRHAHNEQSIERRELRKELIDKGIINLQPSYVVVFSDMNEKLQKKACKCAEDFGIPIVYIDKQKIVQNESDKIDKMIDELNNTKDINQQIVIFSDIYLKHENNRCGLIHDEELKTKFSTGRIEKVLNDIVDKLIEEKNHTLDYRSYCENVLQLVDILQREEDKFITCYETGSRVAFNDIDINKYIMKMYREIDNSLCEVNNSNLSIIASTVYSDDSLLSQELRAIDSKKIADEIRSFNETEFYKNGSKNHNLGHIERVTVLASMIGKKEFPNDKHFQQLLRLSAELHDSGRKTDDSDYDHSKKGVMHAEKVLQSKLQNGEIKQNDLHIIQFAIEYHEFDHFRGDNEEQLKKLAKKYQIGDEDFEYTRKIAECLKDADALDRVRFHRIGATLDERRLITSSSHDYINTAKKLLQEYKNYDKNQFVTKTMEKCKEREENHRLFKQSELKYKMKSKFEKIMARLKNITNNNNSIEGDFNGVRRR